jgi:hypothetical protein
LSLSVDMIVSALHIYVEQYWVYIYLYLYLLAELVLLSLYNHIITFFVSF